MPAGHDLAWRALSFQPARFCAQLGSSSFLDSCMLSLCQRSTHRRNQCKGPHSKTLHANKRCYT